MSASLLHSDKSHREFLPDALGSGLRSWLRRGLGAGLLFLTGLGWLGLLSWELPSTEPAAVGGGLITHLFGKLPAQTADVLLQSLGFGAAVLFSIPTFWAIEHLSRRPLGRPVRRLLLWPLTSLTAASALSALPAPDAWPFARGLGGVVGDQGLGLLRMALSFAGPDYASGLGGAGLAAAATCLFVLAVRSSSAADADLANASANLGFNVEPALEKPAARSMDRETDSSKLKPNWSGELSFAPDLDAQSAPSTGGNASVRMVPPRKGQAPAFVRMAERDNDAAAGSDAAGGYQPGQSMHVPYDDLPDDDQSRHMAQRFAPAASRRDEDDVEEAPDASPSWPGWRAFLERAGEAVAPLTGNSVPFLDDDAEPLPQYVEVAAATKQSEPPSKAPKASDMATATVRTWAEAAAVYRVPPVTLLSQSEAKDSPPENDNVELVAAARRLEDVLVDFGVRGKIISVLPGPIVTHYELEAAAGVKLTRVIGLAEDIARAFGVSTARVAAIPGRSSVGIELPNERHEKVSLRGLMETRSYKHNLHALPLAIGMGVDRQPIISDLAQMPGLLVAGSAGSGKSTTLGTMLLSLLLRHSPEELRLLVIDPKGVDHQAFDGIGHLLAPVLKDPGQAMSALAWCVAEMEERLKVMSKLNMRGIGVYNNAVRNALRQGTGFKRAVQTGFDRQSGRAIYEEEVITPKAMPYVVVVIDDLELLLQAEGAEADSVLQRLGQMSRAAGIHIIAATGKLETDRISAGLRANLPARLCFKLGSKSQSRLILNDGGAELLLGAGDLLFGVGGAPVRGQAPMLGNRDIAQVTDAIRRQGPASYEPSIGRAAVDPVPVVVDTETYQQAVSIAMQQGSTSVAELRARLGLAYGSANDLLGKMQETGLVASQDDASGRRPVLLGRTASA